MKICDFEEVMKAKVDEFKNHWKKKQKETNNLNEWPAELDFDDWNENFQAWLEES